jgi:hypothetical protein
MNLRTVQYSGVKLPAGLDPEELFLNTLMACGAPPQRPKLADFRPDDEHRSYYDRAVRFWQSQGCTGEQFAFMSFYNSSYVRWLNQNQAGR